MPRSPVISPARTRARATGAEGPVLALHRHGRRERLAVLHAARGWSPRTRPACGVAGLTSRAPRAPGERLRPVSNMMASCVDDVEDLVLRHLHALDRERCTLFLKRSTPDMVRRRTVRQPDCTRWCSSVASPQTRRTSSKVVRPAATFEQPVIARGSCAPGLARQPASAFERDGIGRDDVAQRVVHLEELVDADTTAE